MRVDKTNGTTLIEFDSIKSFYDYCVSTPYNNAFVNVNDLESITGGYSFTKTNTFEEAVELLLKGWTDMSKQITQQLNVLENEVQQTVKPRPVTSVQGYHPIVPMYLNNQPNAMVNNKMVPVKQKVVTVNKSIDYAGKVSADDIMKESIKALMIVKKLEAQGIRVNLNVVLGSSKQDFNFCIKVRIKSAGEKLNVSKMAFPLVHPSMLRRLFFRFIEVYPEITKSFVNGYGKPATTSEMRGYYPNDYLLPNFVFKNVDKINTIKDLENL